jgi:hypothetical protein
MLDVLFDGADANVKLIRDFPVSESVDHERQYFQFAWAERFDQVLTD